MKKLKNLLLLSVGFLAMTVTGCNRGNGETSKEPEKEDRPIVFVMSGQSNMEGNTAYGKSATDTSYLTNAFKDLGIEDGQCCIDGIESVKTSFYGNGYGELSRDNYNTGGQSRADRQPHASNTEDKIKGKFLATKIGMGHTDSMIGPELGCAYALKDKATAEKPIYFIKMSSSGSGFAQSGSSAEGKNWLVKNEDGTTVEHTLYSDFLTPFLKNNLDLIEETTGKKPVIKGWLWHQGESDCDGGTKTAKYAQRLGDLVAQFREDFKEYASQGEGANIAFIDGMVYQGKNTAWTKPADMNAQKQQFADSNNMNFLVDTYANEEATDANELKPGSPGGDNMHYNTKSSFRLGMAYGKVIIDNNLLD